MSNLAGVSGTIGTIVGLGFTLGALGLTLEFVNRAVDRATPQPQGKRRKYKPVFEVGMGNYRSSDSVFSPMQSKSKGKNSNANAYENFFGGY